MNQLFYNIINTAPHFERSKIVFAAPQCVVYLLFEKYTSIPVNDSFYVFQLNLVSDRSKTEG